MKIKTSWNIVFVRMMNCSPSSGIWSRWLEVNIHLAWDLWLAIGYQVSQKSRLTWWRGHLISSDWITTVHHMQRNPLLQTTLEKATKLIQTLYLQVNLVYTRMIMIIPFINLLHPANPLTAWWWAISLSLDTTMDWSLFAARLIKDLGSVCGIKYLQKW